MTSSDVMMLDCLDTFVSPQSGVTLTVCRRSFGQVPVEDVLSGKCSPTVIYGSQDGRGWVDGVWHKSEDGEESEGVWVERWTLGGCQFHGVVDSVSRKVVQVG